MRKGIIFNIQGYSIHDGPGIRTDVFLKGCFLHCIWCQNPESQSLLPELFYFEEKCTGCGRCAGICPQSAIQINKAKSNTDRHKCKGCGQCVQVCPNGARSLMGKEMTVQEVFQKVKAEEIFYKRSKGGVTLTGGEPLSQPDFSKNLLFSSADIISGWLNFDSIGNKVTSIVSSLIFIPTANSSCVSGEKYWSKIKLPKE